MKTRNVFTVSALALISSVALAGLVVNAPVVLDRGARSAFGSMTSARFSDNPFESIGCGVRNTLLSDGSLFRFGFCLASVGQDDSFLCFSDNDALIEEMSEGNDYSFISFGWNEAGECTRVGFSTQSQYIPQHLDKKSK